MKFKREICGLLLSGIAALSFFSCTTTGGFFDEKPHEETEAEKAISYPFTVFGWYKGRLMEVEFYDASKLIVSFPRIGGAKKLVYLYKMHSTLYSWKRGHNDMQLCGIELRVLCVQEKGPWYGEDWLTFCRKGDFSKPILDPMNYTDHRTRDKTYIVDFFKDNLTYRKIEDDDYDFSYSALPTVRFQRMDERLRQEKQKNRESRRTGGATSIRRQYK